MFADGTAPRQYDRDIGRRNIHAFIEHFARHHDRILPRIESLQHRTSFLDRTLMRNGRNQILPADAIDSGIVCRKNNRSVLPVNSQKFIEQLQFCPTMLGYCPLRTMGMKGCAPL